MVGFKKADNSNSNSNNNITRLSPYFPRPLKGGISRGDEVGCNGPIECCGGVSGYL